MKQWRLGRTLNSFTEKKKSSSSIYHKSKNMSTTSSTISSTKEMKSQPLRKRVIKTVCSINASRPRKHFIWDSSNPNNNAQKRRRRAASTKGRPKKKLRTSSEPNTKSRNPLQESPKKLRTASKPKTKSRKPVSGRQEEISEEPKVASPQVDEKSPQQKSAAPLVKTVRRTAKVMVQHRETSDTAKNAAAKAAKARQESLAPETQAVIKSLTPSNVYRVFWMGLPKEFCDANLTDTKSDIYLVDNQGKEFRVTYLPHKSGLSGGWVSFAREKGLHNCDAVLFEVITRTRLKVHVFRSEEDGSIVEIM